MTMGGKIRCKTRGGTKDMKISRKEHIRDVPEVELFVAGLKLQNYTERTQNFPVCIRAGSSRDRSTWRSSGRTGTVFVHGIENLKKDMIRLERSLSEY